MSESPSPQAHERRERPVICPYCGSDATEPYAMFGSMLLLEQHYCCACKSVFERVHDDQPAESAS
jgi:hypothetical protein